MSDTQTAPQQYQATLTGGQTYVFAGRRFEHDEPQTIDAGMFAKLRKVTKSVKQGQGDDVRRVNVPMFKFAKVKFVKPKEKPFSADDNLEDIMEDEILDTVEIETPATNPEDGEGVDDQSGEGGEEASEQSEPAKTPNAPKQPRSRARAKAG